MESFMDADHKPSILMFPWLSHGHISPFLELAKKLSERNFQIYFCSTPVILQPIRETLPEIFSSSIQLVDLHLPSSPDLPPHRHSATGLPPHLSSSLLTALDLAKPSFSAIVRNLRPDLIVYDINQPWVPLVAREENIKGSILFLTTAVSAMSIFYDNLIMNDDQVSNQSDISNFLQQTVNGIRFKERHKQCFQFSSQFILCKTSKEIEPNYFTPPRTTSSSSASAGLLAGKRLLPTGPLVLNNRTQVQAGDSDRMITDWLDKKPHRSVVFLSFGSELYLSKDEIEEIAYGLELGGVCFVWALRFDKNELAHIDEALPSGFLGRTRDEDRGLVIQGWAPQLKILGHRSIGGFLSHCGWSSITEAMVLGVPIIAMPIKNDEPYVAIAAVEIGVAKEVGRDEDGKMIRRENVAKAIEDVVKGEEGEVLRRRARALSEKLREKGDEELDDTAEELRQLCMQ